MATDATIRNNPTWLVNLRAQCDAVLAEIDALEAMSDTERANAAGREATVVSHLDHMARYQGGRPIDAPLADWKQSEALELNDGSFIARRDYDPATHTLA